MSKELEEVKQYLEHEVSVYENNKEINRIIGGKVGEKQHEINKTMLNYIDNSIPKEVVEEKIELLKDTLDLLKADKKVAKYKILAIEIEIQDLQELLEGK